MKKHSKLLAVILSVALILSMTACGKEPAPQPTPEPTPVATLEPTPVDSLPQLAVAGNVEIIEWNGNYPINATYSDEWKRAVLAKAKEIAPDIVANSADEDIEEFLYLVTALESVAKNGEKATGEQVMKEIEWSLDTLADFIVLDELKPTPVTPQQNVEIPSNSNDLSQQSSGGHENVGDWRDNLPPGVTVIIGTTDPDQSENKVDIGDIVIQ